MLIINRSQTQLSSRRGKTKSRPSISGDSMLSESLKNIVMQLERDSLLYCAFAIAVFDLLCAVLFAALSLCKIFSHLSWLTIFATCFGLFWLTLIALLISGIYRRNPRLVRAWLIFSTAGIFIETCLIVYAFFSQSAFQIGMAENSLILCIGLFVETIFVFIIYQFYLMVSKSPQSPQKRRPRPIAMPTEQPSRSQLGSPPAPNPSRYPSSTQHSSRSFKCHILQSPGPTSPYACEPKQIPYNLLGMKERSRT